VFLLVVLLLITVFLIALVLHMVKKVKQYRTEAAMDYSYSGLGSGSEHEVSFTGSGQAVEMSSTY
jgi:hypothetical protein